MALDWDSVDDRVMDKTFNSHLCRIEEHVYIGDALAAQQTLQSRHIRAMLSIVSVNDTLPELGSDAIDCHRIVLTGNDTYEDLLTHFPRALTIIGHYVSRGAAILVYCADGSVRCTAVAIAYLMAKYTLNVRGGQRLVAAKRRLTAPVGYFSRQLSFFETMGYTLDANNREFRQYLLDMYVSDIKTMNKYWDRLAVAETMTPQVMKGRSCVCRQCGFVLFYGIHVITNDTIDIMANNATSDDQNWSCDRVFIEPQLWMREFADSGHTEWYNGTIVCGGCDQPVAKVEPWVQRFGCKCTQHLYIQCLLIRVIENTFKVFRDLK